MGTAPSMSPALLEQYRAWFVSVFLDVPMHSPGLESLVFEDAGEIVAFLGVVARQVTVGGKVYRGSCASNFCIRATHRGRLGMRIAREYLSRSNDLAFIDELVDRPRRLWDHLGMQTMPQSVRWTLPLRPAQHVLSIVGIRTRHARNAVLRAPAALVDAVAGAIPRNPFRYGASALAETALTGAGLDALLGEFGTAEYLRPVTTDGSAGWLLERARSMTQHGELHAIALQGERGDVVGWFVYYARAGLPCEVMQLVATPAAAGAVLEHLAVHARTRGVVSLTGTLDWRFLSPLSAHWAVLSPTPIETRWMMVHSAHRDVLEAFWRNNVLLSRLDGEWFQHFP